MGDIINVADKNGNIKGKIEITDVWLQQVNDISESDAKAEGFDGKLSAYSSEFALMWNAIYGTDSWINNEWAWVIEFVVVS
ncbi:ASCH domain-containing protein [Providencia manganoxydans]|nr:ASCH domain-containing protein [Providencia manganoxydans]MDX4947469.1 ASCH domain-containing protein [Providencia manganoxydans]